MMKHFGHLIFEGWDCAHDWVDAAGRPRNALLYSPLFMPDLALVADSVLLSAKVREGALGQVVQQDGLGKGARRRELERAANFVDISDYFEPSRNDTTDEEDLLLAQLVRDAWDGWLRLKFPRRRFTVSVVTPDGNGGTLGVCFFEDR